MLLLIDGYNVTMSDPATVERAKEQQREALVARLRVRSSELAPRGTIVAVFDAHGQLGLSEEDRGGVRMVFAAVADDEIVRRCARAKGRIEVVTNDMRLRARIAQDVGRHVTFLPASAVYEGAARPTRPKARGGIARETGLPPGHNSITQELKDLWLSEEEE